MVERPIRKNAKAKKSETLQADKKVDYTFPFPRKFECTFHFDGIWLPGL